MPSDLTNQESAVKLARALRHVAMQRTPATLAAVTSDHCHELVACAKAECVFYDSETSSFWRVDTGDVIDATAGLLGVVAASRSGLVTRLQADEDATGGSAAGAAPAALLALEPIVDAAGALHAALILSRPQGAPFEAVELQRLKDLARRLAVIFESLHLELDAESRLESLAVTQGDAVFNREALRVHRRGAPHGVPVDVPTLLPLRPYLAALVVTAVVLLGTGLATRRAHAVGRAIVLSRDTPATGQFFSATPFYARLQQGSPNAMPASASSGAAQSGTASCGGSSPCEVVFFMSPAAAPLEIGSRVEFEPAGQTAPPSVFRVSRIGGAIFSDREIARALDATDFFGASVESARAPYVLVEAEPVQGRPGSTAVDIATYPGLTGSISATAPDRGFVDRIARLFSEWLA